MKTGIFGGSFNPIHRQHVKIAQTAIKEAGLDEVWFVPIFKPVHKVDNLLIPYEDRVNLIKTAIESEQGLCLCEVEKELGGLSYTLKTVEYLQNNHKSREFFLIIGGDSLENLPSWHNPEKLIEITKFILVERPEFTTKIPFSNMKTTWLKMPLSKTSASGIRYHLKNALYPIETLENSVLFEIFMNNSFDALGTDYSKWLSPIKELHQTLPEGILRHIFSTAKLAMSYCTRAKIDPRPAWLAAISHDLFRLSNAETIYRYASKSGFKLSNIEKQTPMLAHGAAAAGFLNSLLPKVYTEIIEAVRFHTFPSPDVDLLTKILVVSDTLDPSRENPELDKLRNGTLSVSDLFRKILLSKIV